MKAKQCANTSDMLVETKKTQIFIAFTFVFIMKETFVLMLILDGLLRKSVLHYFAPITSDLNAVHEAEIVPLISVYRNQQFIYFMEKSFHGKV